MYFILFFRKITKNLTFSKVAWLTLAFVVKKKIRREPKALSSFIMFNYTDTYNIYITLF